MNPWLLLALLGGGFVVASRSGSGRSSTTSPGSSDQASGGGLFGSSVAIPETPKTATLWWKGRQEAQFARLGELRAEMLKAWRAVLYNETLNGVPVAPAWPVPELLVDAIFAGKDDGDIGGFPFPIPRAADLTTAEWTSWWPDQWQANVRVPLYDDDGRPLGTKAFEARAESPIKAMSEVKKQIHLSLQSMVGGLVSRFGEAIIAELPAPLRPLARELYDAGREALDTLIEQGKEAIDEGCEGLTGSAKELCETGSDVVDVFV